VSGASGERARAAPSAASRVNKLGVTCKAGFWPKPDALGDAGSRPFEDSVGGRDELQCLVDRARLLNVEGDRSFASPGDEPRIDT